MAQVTIKKEDGPVVLGGGALAAGTDFQVTSGECRMTTGSFAADNDGFRFAAFGPTDKWFAASGKTVTVRTDSRAVIVFEALA